MITNDDIDAAHAHDSDQYAGGNKNGSGFGNGACDDDCAAATREQMGLGPAEEGEWQIRLAAARRDLTADSEWRRAYAEMARAVNQTCVFQYRQEAAVLPTGNDWGAGVERAKRQQYVENMTRVLQQNISRVSAQLDRMAQQVRPLDAVRATMMSVLESRLYDSCAEYGDP